MKDFEKDDIFVDDDFIEPADEGTNLFDIAEKIEKLEDSDISYTPDECDSDRQVDLFEYADHCENQSTSDVIVIQESEQTDFQPAQPSGTPPRKKKRLKGWIISLISLVMVLVILITTFVSIFTHYYNKLDYTADEVKSYYTAPDVMSADYVTNILLIGTDERNSEFSDNARSDSMMILSVNKNTHTISIVSLERGMRVNYINSNNSYSSDLLTHVFKYVGAGGLVNTVENTFKVKIDGYVRVNFYTFEKIIDNLGGIDIELSEKEVYGLNTEKRKGQVIRRKLDVGMNHLNGSEALLYARLRWIDSDFQRVKRQRKVLVAVKDKMKDASIFELIEMSEEILPLMRTNIKSGEMFKLILDLSSSANNDVQQMTIPVDGTYVSLSSVDFDKNSKILQELLYQQ